ncbi:hypothetical protein [Plantactinospora veratri]
MARTPTGRTATGRRRWIGDRQPAVHLRHPAARPGGSRPAGA